MVRAVLDTNVLVSGLITRQSPPARVLDAWLDGRFALVTSVYQVEELNHVLSYPHIASRIYLQPAELEIILAGLLVRAEVVMGNLQLPGVTRDPKDDPIVACAQEGQASHIVSGDEDILVLKAYQGIQIVNPRQFLQILETPSQSPTT